MAGPIGDAAGIVHGAHAHHHYHLENTAAIALLQKISIVVIGAFALYTNWAVFVPCFAIGMAHGIHCAAHNETLQPHQPDISCLGFVEQITGMKLTPTASILVGLGMTLEHLEHGHFFGVLISAGLIGKWVGLQTTHWGTLAQHKVQEWGFRRLGYA